MSSRFLSIISSLSICHGSPEAQGVERVYNKMKRAFRNRHRVDTTLVNDAIDHAVAVVNSIAVIAATGTLAEPYSDIKLKIIEINFK